MSYSPHRRTAVLLAGTGTSGAYHAGALRALHEAGVKIDLVSGRGVGTAGAMFAAIDAAGKTWEEQGIWRSRVPARFYAWRASLRWARALLVLAGSILLVPLLVLSTGLIAYPLGFLVQMVSADAGYRVVTAYSEVIAAAFAPGALPTLIPRLITLVLAVAVMVLAVAAGRASIGTPRQGHGHRERWWNRIIGPPWTAAPAIRYFHRALWQLFEVVAAPKRAGASDLSRRYVELLLDNLGQPGFREIIVTAHDLEARAHLVFALLAEPYRQEFFRPSGGRSPRTGEAIDLAGAGRTLLVDALAGSLSLSVVTEPHRIAFSPESYWKGETHRLCDRPDAIARLFEELAAAKVEQVIAVCASADRPAPHHLSLPRNDLRSRIAEFITTSEASSLRDAVQAHAGRFRAIFLIQPHHNPVGPFDFRGAYDERSDRFQLLGEVIDRGYEDAYRQFIDPVVGAGGEGTPDL